MEEKYLKYQAMCPSYCESVGLVVSVPYNLIKVTLITCEKSVVQFAFTKHCRFSLGSLVFPL